MLINGDLTVRELLGEYPEAFGVLAGHGMCADCKADPPPVPLEHFAQKHCGGDLAGLIKEIEAATGASRVEKSNASTTQPCPPVRISTSSHARDARGESGG